MTVEIIGQPEKFFETTCRGCHCRLKFVANDIKVQNNGCDYTGDPNSPDYYVICPGCGERGFVPSKEVPSHLWR
jgi:hypothetical protein